MKNKLQQVEKVIATTNQVLEIINKEIKEFCKDMTVIEPTQIL
jgi:hypothetical protein